MLDINTFSYENYGEGSFEFGTWVYKATFIKKKKSYIFLELWYPVKLLPGSRYPAKPVFRVFRHNRQEGH